MPERNAYPEGAPCWADLVVPVLEDAKRFYSAVLGWEFRDNGADMGHYTMCLVQGKPVAALMPPPPGMEGMPPAWNVYLAAPDVAETLVRVETAGGKPAFGPQLVPGAGTMGFAMDPSGASFGVWQGAEHVGAELWRDPGAMAWHQLNTTEGAQVDAFYRRVFDYAQQEQIGDGANFDYTVWRVFDAPEEYSRVAGRWRVPAEQLPGGRPGWDVFFAVADCDAAARAAEKAGGRIISGPDDSPYGRMCGIEDPFGARFTLSQLAD